MDKVMTALERRVAERVRDGADPWCGNHGVGSRKVSQAIGRLKRKGFVGYGYGPDGNAEQADYFLTELGVSCLGGEKDRAP